MASVSVEFNVFLDPRFRRLGNLSGHSHYDAIGRMAAIWAYCIEKNTEVLQTAFVEVLAEIPGYTDLILAAELAERVDESTIRIKGTVGRIEWLAAARARQKLATKAAAEKRRKDSNRKGRPKSAPKLEPISVSSSSSASTSKKRDLVDPSDTTLLWKFYSQELKNRKIEPVHEGAKTGKLCKILVSNHGLEKAQDLVRAFLNDSDSFVSDQAWSLGLLVSQQQKYLARITATRTKAPLTFGGDE